MSKDKLLEAMRQFDDMTLSTAFVYAKNLTLYGVDVTKEWLTATEQSANLEKAYQDRRRGSMTEARNKLKPCPFCGGSARIVFKRSRTSTNPFGELKKVPVKGGYYAVGCETVDCILYYSYITNQARLMFTAGSKDLIIKRWNRRPEDQVVKELEEWRDSLIRIVGIDAAHLKTDTIDEVLRIIKKYSSGEEK